MNLTKYYALLYAMEVGNLSKAAKQMNYTQSNLSRMITSLEGEFGFPLLVREKDGVRPTPEAKKIEPYLRILLRDSDNFNEIVHRIKYRATDRLCVACSENFSRCFLPDVMQSMLEKYPQLEYQIIVADHGEIEFLAKQGVIDVAFTSPPYPVIEAQIVELLREPIMAVLPPKHPLAAQEAVEPAQLLQYPYILQESGTDEFITQVLGSAQAVSGAGRRLYSFNGRKRHGGLDGNGNDAAGQQRGCCGAPFFAGANAYAVHGHSQAEPAAKAKPYDSGLDSLCPGGGAASQ